MAISGSIFGRGVALSRCPETPPKVQAIHGATSGSPNSELIKALKKVCPPLKMHVARKKMRVKWEVSLLCNEMTQHFC